MVDWPRPVPEAKTTIPRTTPAKTKAATRDLMSPLSLLRLAHAPIVQRGVSDGYYYDQ